MPTLGICGFSGSGKTTLIEALIPRLRSRGLKVAVVKHDAHGLDFDRKGKDTERFFAAGADVAAHDDAQTVFRLHKDCGLEAILSQLGPSYDIILVEGHKGSPLQKLWCLLPDETSAPDETIGVLQLLQWTDRRLEQAEEHILSWLCEQNGNHTA